MPIKKKITALSITKPAPKPPAAKKAAPALAPVKPPRKTKTKVDFGPPPDPANQPGANEKAASVLGQTWKFEVKFSSGGANSFWFSFEEANSKQSGWRWRQCGAALAFENSGGFARYTGRLRGKEASGEGGNRSGTTWTWTATLSESGKRKECAYQDAGYQAPR
jgi:hypothetical protein